MECVFTQSKFSIASIQKFVDNRSLRHFLYCNWYFSPNQSEVIYFLLPFVGFEALFLRH